MKITHHTDGYRYRLILWYAHTFVCSHTCMHAHVCIHTHAHTHIHSLSFTGIHSLTHTYTLWHKHNLSLFPSLSLSLSLSVSPLIFYKTKTVMSICVIRTNMATDTVRGNTFSLPESVTFAPQVSQQSLRSHSPALLVEEAGHPLRRRSPYSQSVKQKETKLQLINKHGQTNKKQTLII